MEYFNRSCTEVLINALQIIHIEQFHLFLEGVFFLAAEALIFITRFFGVVDLCLLGEGDGLFLSRLTGFALLLVAAATFARLDLATLSAGRFLVTFFSNLSVLYLALRFGVVFFELSKFFRSSCIYDFNILVG